MTWMGEGERPGNCELTETQRLAMGRMAIHLESLAEHLAAEPLDPKIEAHLRMAADCLREQVQLNKYYPWALCDDCGVPMQIEDKQKPSSSEYKYLDNTDESLESDIPSVEDLRKMFEEPGGNDDGDAS